MHEKRLISRLTKHWDQLRKDKPLPMWEQFNSSAFSDVWQQCCGWDVEEGQGGMNVYTYTYVGETLKDAMGDDPTGQVFLGNFHHFPGAHIVEKIDEVVKSRTPIVDEGQFIGADSKVIKFRSCLLPFSTTRRGAIQVVLGLSWKAF